MILRPEIRPNDEQAVLDYYLEHYAEVHIVNCTKCGADLAIEVRGEVSGFLTYPNGIVVIPYGSALLASRMRLDGVMGYQCGNAVPNPLFDIEQKKIDAEVIKEQTARRKAKDKTPVTPGANAFPRFVLCDNDTRASAIEEELSPSGQMLPHEVHAIKQRMANTGHRPDVRREGKIEHRESFAVERIK